MLHVNHISIKLGKTQTTHTYNGNKGIHNHSGRIKHNYITDRIRKETGKKIDVMNKIIKKLELIDT